jgi:hypothetical protein
MTTIDLIDVFCRQSIIGIDPIDVFLTIGAQLWSSPSIYRLKIISLYLSKVGLRNFF